MQTRKNVLAPRNTNSEKAFKAETLVKRRMAYIKINPLKVISVLPSICRDQLYLPDHL
jgi:hypothetical protein